MRFLVLESREETGYADTDSGYEFPTQYEKFFHGASRMQPICALIYEPKRKGGRKAFVGWTEISETPKRNQNGLWHVAFDGGIRSFDQIVPLLVNNTPVEHRLREVPPSRRGAMLQGRSVREIPADNAMEILSLGSSSDVRTRVYGVDAALPLVERRKLQVAAYARNATFRDTVLTAYGYRCAVTGLSTAKLPASRLASALEVAHIRPVSEMGPDALGNALVLTPTLHRLFDAGLFTLCISRGHVRVKRHSKLAESVLSNPERGTKINLEEGMPLLLPRVEAMQPMRQFVEFHAKNVFGKAG
jgi:putative restriction endonuclease